jgi:predicted RNA-binding Zn-ribbon protein involved in translation (DUF1610 family)
MNEKQKKMTMLIVALASLIIACLVFFITNAGRSDDIKGFSGKTIWVKCNNTKCQSLYEMDMVEYFEKMKEKNMPMMTPPLKCKDCGKDSLYRAVKCPNCGEVFFYGAKSNQLPDRCSKCGFSQIEEDRKPKK